MCSGPTSAAALEVGDRAGDAEDAVVAAGGEAVAVVELEEQAAARSGVMRASSRSMARRHVGVAGRAGAAQALGLALAGRRPRAPARRRTAARARRAGASARRAADADAMSMRSSSGPERRRSWRARSAAVQRQPASPIPHGHGFEAATSIARVGNVRTRWAAHDRDAPVLERLAQRLELGAGTRCSSSRNSTPWWASVISPGFGVEPPPTSPDAEIMWCGRAERPLGDQAAARRGARRSSGCA